MESLISQFSEAVIIWEDVPGDITLFVEFWELFSEFAYIRVHPKAKEGL